MKEILKNLIEFDTTMSRKNEKECANYIYQYFLERKIKVTMYEPAPNRCSVAAYIPGKRKEQLVVHAHIDTADYGKEKEWKFPPDIATEYKECIVGRGALDCKGLLAIWMKLFSELAKQSHTLERSILFLATADEESGGTYGIQWILQNTKIMEHTFLVIGEGGGYPLPYKDQILYTIQTGEIPPHYCKSESPNCNPEDILNKGIEKGFYNEKTREYCMNPEKRAVRRIEIETLYQGLETFFQEEKQQIAYAKFGESFELALQEVVPNAILIPVITPGYSDNYFMRKKGYAVLGFFPLCLENSLSGIHGNNEYISISSIKIAYKIFSKIILHYILTF